MSNKVRNTAAQDPMLTMIEMLSGGRTPGAAIEAQEARGQRELVKSDVLPTEGLAEAAKALGLVPGDTVAGDEMFTHVTLPEGWTKQRTDHSMWSDLVDDRGRVRASIFYKAAFYDRSASITAVRRFTIRRNFDIKDAIQVRVLDGKDVVFSTEPKQYDAKDYRAREALEQDATISCKAWLVDNGYPEFNDPAKYWD